MIAARFVFRTTIVITFKTATSFAKVLLFCTSFVNILIFGISFVKKISFGISFVNFPLKNANMKYLLQHLTSLILLCSLFTKFQYDDFIFLYFRRKMFTLQI
jgi:hypothetical protein